MCDDTSLICVFTMVYHVDDLLLFLFSTHAASLVNHLSCLCLFIIGLIFFIKFCEFFLLSGYKSFVRCVGYHFFPYMQFCFFHYFNGILHRAKALHFDEVQFPDFFPFMVCFGVVSKIPQALDPKIIIFIWLKTLQKSVKSDY